MLVKFQANHIKSTKNEQQQKHKLNSTCASQAVAGQGTANKQPLTGHQAHGIHPRDHKPKQPQACLKSCTLGPCSSDFAAPLPKVVENDIGTVHHMTGLVSCHIACKTDLGNGALGHCVGKAMSDMMLGAEQMPVVI